MAFNKIINSKKLLAFLAVFMLSGTNMLMAQTADAAAKPGVNWLSVGYYVLLFVVTATVIAIIGRILKVYDLSQQIRGKKGMNWNNIIGVLFLVFLVVGMYGAYWDIT
jgi:cytochrome c oxidase subunit 2